MREPKERKSKAQAVERSRSKLAPLSRSGAKMLQQPVSQRVRQNREESQEVRVRQGCHEHEFVASIPMEESGAFKG